MGLHNYIKISTISPKTIVGKPLVNKDEIINLIKNTKGDILLFPELSITGYSLGDFIYNQDLLDEAKIALKEIMENVHEKVVIIGSILEYNSSLYNVAYVLQHETILGIVPKKFLPRSKEFYEPRYFASGLKLCDEAEYVEIFDSLVPVGDIIFKSTTDEIKFAIEICGDMWSVNAPHNRLYESGAEVVFNLSATTYDTLKEDERKVICRSASLTGEGAYVYCSSSTSETTSSGIFERVHIGCELGKVICEKDDFSQESEVSTFDLDMAKIRNKRIQTGYLHDCKSMNYFEVPFTVSETKKFKLENKISKYPFKDIVDADYNMIFEALVQAIIKRVSVTKAEKLILGVSGGLDSTLTLLILKEVEKRLGKSDFIVGCVLPALVTSDATLNKCNKLLKSTNTTINLVDLKDDVLNHLELLNHSKVLEDTVFENAQARYRTYYMLDLANMLHGIMIGTSDLSENALGFSTFGGDQLANYDAIAGIPKTAVQEMIKIYISKSKNRELNEVLNEVLESKISPELKENQVTEDVLGSYEVNDFIMYHLLGYGAKKSRIIFLINQAFKNVDAELYYNNFINRFKKSQFKRICAPESIKVFDISLNSSDYQLIGDME